MWLAEGQSAVVLQGTGGLVAVVVVVVVSVVEETAARGGHDFVFCVSILLYREGRGEKERERVCIYLQRRQHAAAELVAVYLGLVLAVAALMEWCLLVMTS